MGGGFSNRGFSWVKDSTLINKKEEGSQPLVGNSFFITEFPENLRAKFLFGIFKEYGEIEEVSIPSRRDKRGKRYNFARFDNVKDVRILASKLGSIFFGKTKLYSNILRFHRTWVKEGKVLFLLLLRRILLMGNKCISRSMSPGYRRRVISSIIVRTFLMHMQEI